MEVQHKIKVSMEKLMQLALVACTADVNSRDAAMDLLDTPGRARILRRLTTAGHPRTRKPKPTEPQFPEVKIGETVEKRSVLKTIGRNLRISREDVNFFTKLKYEAAAAEPPYTPYPAPNLLKEP